MMYTGQELVVWSFKPDKSDTIADFEQFNFDFTLKNDQNEHSRGCHQKEKSLNGSQGIYHHNDGSS